MWTLKINTFLKKLIDTENKLVISGDRKWGGGIGRNGWNVLVLSLNKSSININKDNVFNLCWCLTQRKHPINPSYFTINDKFLNKWSMANWTPRRIRVGGKEKVFKEILPPSFPNLMKTISSEIRAVQLIPSKNKHKKTHSKSWNDLINTSDRENLKCSQRKCITYRTKIRMIDDFHKNYESQKIM